MPLNTDDIPLDPAIPPPATTELKFGEPMTFYLPGEGDTAASISVRVGKPVAVTLHEEEFDMNDPDGAVPGAASEWVRVGVTLEGVSGRSYASFMWTYEAPNGTVVNEDMPMMAYEEVNLLAEQPQELLPRQVVRGEVYFPNVDAGGRVMATASAGDGTLAVWG